MNASRRGRKIDYAWGACGPRAWVIGDGESPDHAAVRVQGGMPPDASLHWYANRDSFVYHALLGCNLLPNSDFGDAEQPLAGWTVDAVAPAAGGVDFADDWRIAGEHTAYLFAPADAPRPSLATTSALPLAAGAGFGYRLAGFFGTHRSGATLSLEFIDAEGNLLLVTDHAVPESATHPGGTSLPEYRWLEWAVQPPAAAAQFRLRIALDPFGGVGDPSSFLFFTRLSFALRDKASAWAWSRPCPGAHDLLHRLRDPRWSAWALAPIADDAGALALEIGGAEQHVAVEGGVPAAIATAAAVREAFSLGGRLPVWATVNWAVAGGARLHAGDECRALVAGPVLRSEEFEAGVLVGENLLRNADFSEGLDGWEAIAGSGVDFAPNTHPPEEHTAYIFRRAEEESGACRLYYRAGQLPRVCAGASYQLAGLFGYHRCAGGIGVEWLDADDAVLDTVLLAPKRANARGEQNFSEYDQQAHLLMAPEGALRARVFVQKEASAKGQKDSFLFFTRVFFGYAASGRYRWKPADADLLQLAERTAVGARYFQQFGIGNASLPAAARVSQLEFPDGSRMAVRRIEAADERDSTRSIARACIDNGDFARWGGAIAIESRADEFEAAAGWRVLNPGSAMVDVAAARIQNRDPAAGTVGRAMHALEIRARTAGATLQLAAPLNVVALQPRRPARLRFFLQTADGAPYGCVHWVRLRWGERQIDVGARVQFGPAGRYFEFPVALMDVEHLRAAAEVPELVFSFDSTAGSMLADVSFESIEPVAAQPVATPRAERFEDHNLEAQVARIKVADGWARISRFAQFTRYAPLAENPAVEIVIPVFNALPEVLECLESVRLNTTVPYALTVVDDASEPDVAQALAGYRERQPGMTLIRNEQNIGYTRSANLGMANARARWMVLLNSDTVVTPGWLEGLLECAATDPRIKFVGPLSNAASWQSIPEVVDVNRRFKVNALPSGYAAADMARLVAAFSRRSFPRVRLLNGFCTLLDRQTVLDLGLLDETAFPQGYGEENDLCLRAVAAGHSLAIADHVYVYHAKSASFGSARRDVLSRAGAEALVRKHPGVDLSRAQDEIAESTGLIELRRALRAFLEASP